MIQLVMIFLFWNLIFELGVSEAAAIIYTRNYQGLTEVPDGIPYNVTILELKGNQITSFGEYEFSNYTKLESISLHRNYIAVINGTAFIGTKLSILDLQENKLTHVPRLYGLAESLQEIDLSQNLITAIINDDFLLYPNLKSLFLKLMPISSVTADAFAKNVNLTKLELVFPSKSAAYKCHEWFRNLTDDLQDLKHLRLAYIIMKEFPDMTFIGDTLGKLILRKNSINGTYDDWRTWNWFQVERLVKLYYLEIQDNGLKDIPQYVILLNSTLATLAIMNNDIVQIEPSWFSFFLSTMSKLIDLDLNQNGLTQIPDVSSSSSLKYLRLKSNNITVASPYLLTSAPQAFSQLLLSGNPLACDERNAWIREVQLGLVPAAFKIYTDDIPCSGHLTGRQFNQLTIDEIRPTVNTTGPCGSTYMYHLHAIKGRILENYALKRLKMTDRDNCAVWCTIKSDCTAFSWEDNDKVCELYSVKPQDSFFEDPLWYCFVKNCG